MPLPSTTLRDFGGGWNTSDSDLNLNSRFQPISDNIERGVDGSFGPRQGVGLWCDYATGNTTTYAAESFDFNTTNESTKITVDFPSAHAMTSGDHITISGLTTDINGIDFNEINGTHSVLVVDADSVSFHVRVPATSTGAVTRSVDVVTDDHLLGGNIIYDTHFNNKLIVFTDTGEIGIAENEGQLLTRIWGAAEAEALSTGLVPTRRTELWSAANFKSSVIACNGYDRDKPLQIFDDFTVEYLVDKASSSNAAVPKADYVICAQGYVIFLRTEYGDPFAEFSAKGTDGTFTRDPNPADAVEVDLSLFGSSVQPVVLGAGILRDKLYVAFYDIGMLGALGSYDTDGNHTPDFTDTIAEHGTVSHRTIVSLGNDIFMCDYAGVPSVGISQQSGVFTPVRLSELISPNIQAHLSSLSEETLRRSAFAVYNRNNRSYMLFLPIYDEVAKNLEPDPFLFNNALRELNYAYVRMYNHRLFEDSYVTVAGSNDVGSLTAANINGVRKVVSIIDNDTFVIELGGAPDNENDTSGGGNNVTITPVNNEKIVYSFEYNKEFKIRRWTRYRGWDFDCGCSSQRGKVFLAKGLKVYRMGDNEIPIYADFVGDYDQRLWDNDTLYVAGTRVLDTSEDIVYRCVTEHTSPSSGTFAEFRELEPEIWERYEGEPINWALETPWSPMNERGRAKINKAISIDSEGYGSFTISAFVNKIRTNKNTNVLAPYRELQMSAGDTGGWDMQYPETWGSGRRTREEKVWPMEVRGKLLRWRFSGSSIRKQKITALTMYYKLGNMRTS